MFLCLIKHSGMNTCGDVNEKLQAFLNFVLGKEKSKASPRGRFQPAEGTFGGWVPELV
jgi:hypothetical protein